jgi:hypothetical protein
MGTMDAIDRVLSICFPINDAEASTKVQSTHSTGDVAMRDGHRRLDCENTTALSYRV